MKDEIETWEEARLDRAIELLEPMAATYAKLKSKRKSLGE